MSRCVVGVTSLSRLSAHDGVGVVYPLLLHTTLHDLTVIQRKAWEVEGCYCLEFAQLEAAPVVVLQQLLACLHCIQGSEAVRCTRCIRLPSVAASGARRAAAHLQLL